MRARRNFHKPLQAHIGPPAEILSAAKSPREKLKGAGLIKRQVYMVWMKSVRIHV
jgi:hypothetical protein